MTIRWIHITRASMPLLLLVSLRSWAAEDAHPAQPAAPATPAPPAAPAAPAPAVAHARGTFTVALEPQSVADTTLGPGFSRLSARKQFEGDLAGTSSGEMLGFRSAVEGSAGYVAIERVSGTLQGRTGTFALQHSGTMMHGALQLTITIVPDSGTDGLHGIAGAMGIKIVGKNHFYDLEYSLPAP